MEKLISIRLMIVDDHAIVRQGLRAIIRVTPGLELVCEADGGQAAVELAAIFNLTRKCSRQLARSGDAPTCNLLQHVA